MGGGGGGGGGDSVHVREVSEAQNHVATSLIWEGLDA